MTQEVLEAVKEAKEQSKPRNFTQSVDMIINVRDLDVKKPENRFNEEVTLPNGRGKDVKIGVIADGELIVQAKDAGVALVINKDDLEALGKDRKQAKSAANSVDFFIAQADMRWNTFGIIQPNVLNVRNPGAKIIMGDNVGISGSTISARQSIIIGNNVLIGSGCVICDNDAHPIHPMNRQDDRKTEVSPIVGSEKQSEELVNYLLSGFENDPKKIWDSNIFGRSLHELVNEGLQAKLAKMPEDAQIKLQETLERIVNEGSGGLICIIL